MNDPQVISSTLEKIKVMQAYCDGKEIEYKYRKEEGNWSKANKLAWMWNEFDYRVKPTPKLRAWTIDEVPLDAWYEHRSNKGEYIRIEGVSIKETLIKLGRTWYSLAELQRHFQYSLDQGKTWRMCGKEEV